MSSIWIRSASWDAAWILSGPPIGVLLVIASIWLPPHLIVLAGMGVLGTAHLVAPIMLTWTHPEMRRRALGRPAKFIGLPVLLLGASSIVGLIAAAPSDGHVGASLVSIPIRSFADLDSPLMALAMVYLVWNAYHFGMQNFGVLSIYRRKAGVSSGRNWDMGFCLSMIIIATALPFVLHLPWATAFLEPVGWGVTIVTSVGAAVMLCRERSSARAIFIIAAALGPTLMLWWGFLVAAGHRSLPWLPYFLAWPLIWGFALITINHYLVSIGLASHICSQRLRCSPWLFVVAVLIVGVAVFALLFGKPQTLTLHVTTFDVSLRLALGFVHFLYDRWLYKFSDPQVRATMGKHVFGLSE